MGGAQASLCSCWERQKLPEDFRPPPPPPPARAGPPRAEPSASAAENDFEDEEIDVVLCTENTFLEYRQVARCKIRSRSVPKSMRPCKNPERVNAVTAGNMGENVGVQLNHVPDEFPPIDDAFEPFLTREMVAADRVWRREVLGLMAWRNVPARPHCCGNTCTECCQLDNDSWRLSAIDHVRIPGHADPCRALHILPSLPECDGDTDHAPPSPPGMREERVALVSQ